MLWQTFLLVTLLLALAFGIWGQAFSYFYDAPMRARDATRLLVNVVELARVALYNTETEERRGDLLKAFQSKDGFLPDGIRIEAAKDGETTAPLPDTRQMAMIVAGVQETLGTDTRFASQRNSVDGFWVGFGIRASSSRYWVMLPFDSIDQSGVFMWLPWGSALLASVLGVYLVIARIGTPLRRLAYAARLVGSGQTPVFLEEYGPQEIVAVAQAFNQMLGDLAHTASERALLLAGVSHDLRTPLARLRLEIEMLPENSKSDISAMIADIETMDRIIGQFLDYGRGMAQEPMQEVDLAALVCDIASPYRLRGIQVDIDSPLHFPVIAHRLSMRRAIINLVDNALRYAGNEKPIDIHLSMEDELACVEIADRGPGIPPEEIARLRQPFTRMEAARTDTRGAGLGLAIVDRIMHAHDGRFDLLPREGGGLRAILRIPTHITS
jgi:two-component system osmolarity sensor histidine kinase EnvZ